MTRTFHIAAPLAFVAAISCSHGAAAPAKPPTPAPAPAPAAPPAGARGAGGAGGGAGGAVAGGGASGAAGARGGAPGGGGRGTPLTPEQRAARRDSIAGVRSATAQQVLATIAGHENEPAGQVFKNVKVLKDMPAGDFVKAMDTNLGRGLGYNCTSCHVVTDWADDSRNGKVRSRMMLEMVNAINAEQLPKFPGLRAGQNPPKISCVTCHRGSNNVGNQILP